MYLLGNLGGNFRRSCETNLGITIRFIHPLLGRFRKYQEWEKDGWNLVGSVGGSYTFHGRIPSKEMYVIPGDVVCGGSIVL